MYIMRMVLIQMKSIEYTEEMSNRNEEYNMTMGKLSVCATPIGNLEDITLRVINTLRSVDLIAAEDTRRTLKLLNHYEIHKPLISYHEHNKESKGLELIEELRQGKHIALVSDAGMPGISDPGADLIQQCIANDIPFEILPGATAFATALVASGLSTERFSFEGFLDREKKNRRKRLELISNEDRTLILYESPHRLNSTLKDLYEVLGNRRIVLARELTKVHEEFLRGNLDEIIDYYKENTPRGEYVVLVEGISSKERSELETEAWHKIPIIDHLMLYLNEGIDKKDAIQRVAKERNIPKREVYEISIDL
jgi:16S rRNA (cytidine1402-2'-O)-methyltransferase